MVLKSIQAFYPIAVFLLGLILLASLLSRTASQQTFQSVLYAQSHDSGNPAVVNNEVIRDFITPASPSISSPTAIPRLSNTDAVLRLVNDERSKAGLSMLKKNVKLSRSAQFYADEMATQNFFSHTGKDGSTFVDRNKAAGYSSDSMIAENIAAGQKSPQEVMKSWMNSPGHKANILNPEFVEIGIGYAYNQKSIYTHYWVQEFATP